jgi:hypothetical protein
MREVDVVILIEHVARELDVACAVKHLLESHHDLSVEVLSVQTAAPWAVRNLDPRIAVVPFCMRVNEAYTKDFLRRWPGVLILNLAWEQLIYKAFVDGKLPSDPFSREYAFHHVWSDMRAEQLVELGVPRDHVFVNGQPAYGLYLEPYRNRFPTREELAERHGLDPELRWVLFPENYGWGFYPPMRIDSLLAQGLERERIDRLVAFCRDSLAVVLRWCARLAREGGVEMIVRPRPATLVSDFRDALVAAVGEPPAHLHLLKEGSAREWILAADTVFSSYSTTLIESAVAGKRPFMVAPIPMIDDLQLDWYRHVPAIKDEDAFLAAARDPEAAGIGDALRGWAHETMLSRGDPIGRIADELARMAAPGFPRPEIPTREQFPSRHRAWRTRMAPDDPPWAAVPVLGRRLRNLLRRTFRGMLGGNDARFVMAERKVPDVLAEWMDPRDLFDATEVDELTAIWARTLGD